MVAVVVICCAQVYCSRYATCFGSTGAFCDLTTVGGRLSVLCYGIRGFGCGDLLWWFVVFKFTVVATLNILLLTVVIVLCMYAYNAIFSVMVIVDAQLCILKLAWLVSQPLLFCWFWYFVIFKCILAYILPLQWQDKAKMHLNIALHWLWWSCYVCKYVFILLV